VKNGLFSVRVPADASSFDPGADRWLEIGVKRTGEAGYTTLSPRQRITSVPTALAAARVNWNGVFNAPASFPPWTQVSNGISYSAGRVGIGTSAPSNTLHVQGTALFSGPTNGGRIMTTDFAAAGGTQLLGIVSGNNTGPQFRFNTSTTATNFIDVGQNADGDFVVEGNDVPRLVVANSGNVGIGNGTPGYKLDITGNLRATVPSEREVIRLTDGTRSLTSWIGNAGFPGGDGAFFGTTSNHPLVLQTGNNAWVALLPNGNLGIGTLLPGERMDVAGNIRLPRGNKIYFGPESENTDPIYLQAWNNVSNNTIFELVLGDDPAGGAGGESFVISTRAIGGGAFNPRFYFNSDGNAFKAGTQPGWGSISDRRVKHDVSDLHGGLDRLLALRGKTFFYNDPRAMGAAPGLRTGFIAQDVETIFPEWVGQLSDGTKTLTIGGGAFEANTVEALRELRAEKDAQIQELRKQNEALRAENAARQREVDALRGNTEAMTAELNEFKVQLKRIESAISRRAK
jgi:hypothetical protein